MHQTRRILTIFIILAQILSYIPLTYAIPTFDDTTPTLIPTETPTQAPPTEAPASVPTEEPTAPPPEEPASVITEEPASVPTEEPAPIITDEPTAVPTEKPAPVITDEPTTAPTEEPAPELTEESATTPTEEPAPELTEEPTTAPTEEPAPELTEEPTTAPTEEPAPELTEEAEAETTEEALAEVTPEAVSSDDVIAFDLQTFCQLDINDTPGDPFSYTFSAVNVSPDISTFEWRINGGAVISTAQSFNHSFSATGNGTYVVELICIPDVMPSMTLVGQVTINNMPGANFTVSPSTTGVVPFTVDLFSTSTGGVVTYEWTITVQPGSDSTVYPVQTTATASYTLLGAGIYTIQLTVWDAAGNQDIFTQEIAVNAVPPQATFSITPSTGVAPVTASILGIDEGGGPINSWEWYIAYGATTILDWPSYIGGGGAYDYYTGQGPISYVFATAGIYTVRLVYTGDGGNGEVIRSVVVTENDTELTADFTWERIGNAPGGVEYCFTNTSTGQVAVSTWNFDYPTGTPVINNDQVVCVVLTEGTHSIWLQVANASGTTTAESQQPLTVVGAPVAAFNASATAITWGGTVNFTDASTGVITSYSWDFDGDGVEDSSDQNPAGIAIGNISGAINLGANPVRLTVTGPGGSSFVEMIITVQRLELTCDFSGSLSVLPTASAQTYTQNVTNGGGRTISYTWNVPGLAGFPVTGPSFSQSWTPGSYTVTLTATAAEDGASCTDTKTVQVSYPPLDCQMTAPASVLPNGSVYTFDADVTGLAGRTITGYQWYVDGNPVPAPDGQGETYDYSWSVNGTTTSIRYEATASDGSTCQDAISRTAQWSDLQCSITGGSNTPRPTMPSDGSTVQYTYNASLTGDDGRSLTYNWIYNGTSVGTGSSITLDWDWTEIGSTFPLELQVTATGGGATAGCVTNPTRNLTVTLPALSCGAPGGDITPVLNETVIYTPNISNTWGRPWTNGTSDQSILWDFQAWNGSAWVNVDVDLAGDDYTNLFDVAGGRYRVRYSASVLDPAQSCTSNWRVINVSTGTNATFDCEGWNGGDTTPTDPDPTSYAYTVRIDNTNRLELQYTWVLVDAGGSERTWGTQPVSIADGVITSPSFNGSWFGPIGDYTLRVDVESIDTVNPTDYTCSMQQALNVGTFDVEFSMTGTPNAIEVGEEICLTNLSTTSHDGIDGLNYTWDFGTAANSLGAQTSTEQQPGCMSFSQQGAYAINLTGTNPSGSRTATYTINIEVWDAQAILINRTDDQIYAGNTLGFAATGTNINTYTWYFYTVPGGAQVGTNTGANVTRFFGAAGFYRARVVGTGPLGNTEAELMFELISLSDIRAAFTPTRYAGVAPMEVCFTDRSRGTNLVRWEWDFGNGETLTYDNTSIPGAICTTYTGIGQNFPVVLWVENGAGTRAQATNQIHTYTLLESSATFTVVPQNSGRYCYTSVLPSGVRVTGWAFGDGNTGGSDSATCHNYNASGTYIVQMSIIGPGGETGTITRTVVVNVSSSGGPTLTSDASCSAERTATFTFTNTGTAMTVPDEVRFIDNNGVVFQIANLQLNDAGASGDSETFTFTDQSGTIRAELVDNSGSSVTTDCEFPPQVSVTGMCLGTAIAFQITNADGPMLDAQTYEIQDSAGNVLVSSSFNLARGATPLTVRVPASQPDKTYRFVSTGAAGDFNLGYSNNCSTPTDASAEAAAGETAIVTLPIAAANTGGDVLSVNGVDWSAVTTCTIGCPTFRSYHSDETGDWDIYRIDGWNADTRETFRQNLSLHDTATDMAPSVSPNGMWVVFTSNRDTEADAPDNWEIYVAPTSGENPDAVRRVTHNTIAIDTDPVWGPSNFVAFETTRHGNWDLYAVDMSTGIEYRLTDTESDDINPVWSPDGSKLVYQNNRDGSWQLYELDLYTMSARALTSDTNTHMDPQFAPDGRRIAYRFYGNDNNHSRIAIMDIHSGAKLMITGANEDATNHAWSPSGAYIAYQSDSDGDLDIYIYEVATGQRRQLTDNDIRDYAPSWLCSDDRVIFTSDVNDNPDIFEANATPINGPALDLITTTEADQITFENFNDIYPQVNPSEENASREGRTSLGIWGEHTSYLQPPIFMTPIDLTPDNAQREDWPQINACTTGG